jgi:glutathione S-transferase
MTRTLYELAGRDEFRFSPYCWRSLFALKHKGLDFGRVPMKFTDRACIAASGQDRVPVLDDGGTIVSDSWNIAVFLESEYPDRPSLFGGPIGQGTALVFNKWVDMSVQAALRPIAVPGAFKHVDPDDRDWFRVSREAIFGTTLEALAEGQTDALAQLRAVLEPVRAALASQPYLCGEAPAYVDYILMGSFMWPRGCSDVVLLETDDPVYAWRARMLGLFDGFAAGAAGYAAA